MAVRSTSFYPDVGCPLAKNFKKCLEPWRALPARASSHNSAVSFALVGEKLWAAAVVVHETCGRTQTGTIVELTELKQIKRSTFSELHNKEYIDMQGS